jgi:hypothetical protein
VESIFLSAIDMYGHQFCPENLKVSLRDRPWVFLTLKEPPSFSDIQFRVARMDGPREHQQALGVVGMEICLHRAAGLSLSWPIQG